MQDLPETVTRHLPWAREQLRRHPDDSAVHFVAGAMAPIVRHAALYSDPYGSQETAARTYALFVALEERAYSSVAAAPGGAMPAGVDGYAPTGRSMVTQAAAEVPAELAPAPPADASGYRLANYSGPLRLIEAPCGCGSTHNVAIPAGPVGAL